MEPSLEMKRPFVQKWGWEGSALELFKDLQTLLITFKEVFLKALLTELRTHPLFQRKCSNEFWSQTLKRKIWWTQHRAYVTLLYSSPVSDIPIQQRLTFHHQVHQPSTCHAHRIFDQENGLYHKQGKIYFHKRYLDFDKQGLSFDFLFGYTFTSYLPFQWSGCSSQ